MGLLVQGLDEYFVGVVVMSLAGFADLPLHDGVVPRWLFERMKKLSRLIVSIMVEEFGVRETVRRFSHPVFFQAFNNIIGMDWDSSGSTTITTAVLREALKDADVGILVLGGKGKRALQVPEEIDRLPDRFNIDRDELKLASRLVAKVDNAAVQDGYQIYHHAVIVGEDGSWTIIQQGMNVENKLARRYHWWCETTFIRDPHSGILGIKQRYALNLVSSRSENVRKTIVDLVQEGPVKIIRDFNKVKLIAKQAITKTRTILDYLDNVSKDVPYYNPYIQERAHEIVKLNINEKALERAKNVDNFRDLLLTPGLGPNTLLALVLIAELIYSTYADWNDPVTHDPRKYAFALGGKDGSPYPVDPKVYDDVITILQAVVDHIKSSRDRGLMKYLKHLADVARKLRLPVDKVFPTPP